MATKTFTMASATAGDRVYIDGNFEKRTITQNQTFALDMTDDGSTAHYTGLASDSEMTLTDGGKIYLVGDPGLTYMNVTADTNVNNAGSLWIREEDNSLHEIVIKNVDLDDADVPTTCTMILERKDAPIHTWTWTGITVA